MTVYEVSNRAKKSFERIDSMDPSLRECVHEFGEAIVQACLQAGVYRPGVIRQLVREIWEGARQPTQRRPLLGNLDWLLVQAGAGISAPTLIRVLRDNNHVVVPTDPTTAMIEASLSTVSGYNVRVDKREKHRLRLVAALKAGALRIDYEKLRRASRHEAAVA